MAFLDNSGDIILDAVLTDAGRKRMAEGTFKIEKFALGDDEIDYSLYNKFDSRGSAYYDIDILSTPVLEAPTDNMSGLKSKLISIPRTDLLYLPVIKLYEGVLSAQRNTSGSFYVAVNSDTFNAFNLQEPGLLGQQRNNYILLHQGIDNEEMPHTNLLQDIAADLVEEQYIVEIDNRLGVISSNVQSNQQRTDASVSYIDDDNIASYLLTLNNNSQFISLLNLAKEEDRTASSIAGSRGTSLQFTILPAAQLVANDFLFLRLGDVVTIGSNTFYYIDANVRVMGATTGYRVDIPVRFLKKQ